MGDGFIIMDSDGEDNPLEIKNIIKLVKSKEVQTITMDRKFRHESFLFSILYELHLVLTLLLTFHYIRFGNFTYLSLSSVKKILYLYKNKKNLIHYCKNQLKLRISIKKQKKFYQVVRNLMTS